MLGLKCYFKKVLKFIYQLAMIFVNDEWIRGCVFSIGLLYEYIRQETIPDRENL